MVNYMQTKENQLIHCMRMCYIAESDDQHSVASSEKQEPQYTEVQIRQADPSRGDDPRNFYYFPAFS